MLKDITIGQHFPGHSILHRCDPRLKLVATIAYIVVLFVAPNPLGLALSILLLAALYKVAQIPGKMILKSLKPIVPIVIFTAVLNLFFVTGQGSRLYTSGFEHLCRRCQVCHPAGGARLRTDCRHEPADLHDQSHRTDRRHREPAAPAGEAALSRA